MADENTEQEQDVDEGTQEILDAAHKEAEAEGETGNPWDDPVTAKAEIDRLTREFQKLAEQDGQKPDEAEAEEQDSDDPVEEDNGWSLDALPVGAQKYIKELRAENADKRTKSRSLTETVSQKDLDIVRRDVLIDNEFPRDYLDLLDGDSEDAIKAKAEKLKSLLEQSGNKRARTASRPGGGRNPGGDDITDPIELRKAVRRQRF